MVVNPLRFDGEIQFFRLHARRRALFWRRKEEA